MKNKALLVVFVVFITFLVGCGVSLDELLVQSKTNNKTPPAEAIDLDSKLANLTNQIVDSLAQKKNKPRVAITDFSNLDGNATQFGKYLSEELITRLFKTGKFDIVERNMLNKVIKEHSLNLTGLFDQESVHKIGQLLGVNSIVSGTLTDLGNSVKVNARIIATETGSIFAVASVDISKDQQVTKLLAKKAKSSYQPEGKVGRPAKWSPTAQEEPPPSKPKEKVIKVVEAKQFIFKLKEIKRSYGAVIFGLTVSNNGDKEREFWIYQRGIVNKITCLYDNTGNQYVASLVELGVEKTKEDSIFAVDHWINQHLLPQIPVKVGIRFKDVSPQATSATLVIYCSSRGSFKAVFRDVALPR